MILLATLLGIVACTPSPAPKTQARPFLKQPGNPDAARVTVYLEVEGRPAREASLRLTGLQLLGRNSSYDLEFDHLRLSRNRLVGQQLYLGCGFLSPALVTGIRLTCDEIALDGHPAAARAPEIRLELPLDRALSLEPESRVCLFVDWTAQATSADQPLSALHARAQQTPLGRDLVTVLCPEINTIYQLYPNNLKVAASFGLSGELGECAFDARRRRFYVVDGSRRQLDVIDTTSSRQSDAFSLPLTDSPQALALSEDGRFAFITDTMTDRLLKLDLDSGLIIAESKAALKPERITLFSHGGSEQLAVCSAAERRVHIFSAADLSLSASIAVNGAPAATAVAGDYLFVADRQSDRLLVYNLPSLSFAYFLQVGRGPEKFALDGNRLYSLCRHESYLSRIVPGQQTVLRRLFCQPKPLDLAISKTWSKIFVADQAGLSTLDLNSGKTLKTVTLGGTPAWITLWEP